MKKKMDKRRAARRRSNSPERIQARQFVVKREEKEREREIESADVFVGGESTHAHEWKWWYRVLLESTDFAESSGGEEVTFAFCRLARFQYGVRSDFHARAVVPFRSIYGEDMGVSGIYWN